MINQSGVLLILEIRRYNISLHKGFNLTARLQTTQYGVLSKAICFWVYSTAPPTSVFKISLSG